MELEVHCPLKGPIDVYKRQVFNQSLAVPAGRSKTVILFIDIGPVTTSSFDKFYRGTITITLSKLNNQTATFTFNGLISDPSSTVS